MTTRSEKYISKRNGSKSRTKKNQELYRSIYQGTQYSNIEGITDISKKNSIDIDEVRKLLQSKKGYQDNNNYDNIIDKPYKEKPNYKESSKVDIYNLKDAITEAKKTKVPDNKERVLRNTQYEISKNIDVNKNLAKQPEEVDLKNLINTITSTSMLNKVKDAELAADLLSDLKGNDDTKVGQSNLVAEMKSTKMDKTNTNTIDRSFFTSSLSLSKKDLVNPNGKKKSKLAVFMIVVLALIVLVLIGYGIYIFFM